VSAAKFPNVLTHYYRPFASPLQSISRLSEREVAEVLAQLAAHEPLPFRLTHSTYLSERRRIEEKMRVRFVEKGGSPRLPRPHYFVLGEFSLWEADGSLKVQTPLGSIEPESLSFTLTDSVFNYRPNNLRGIPIPPRAYHGELFRLDELQQELGRHDLPTDDWRSDPDRRFEVYVEAQIWSDEPIQHLLGDNPARKPTFHETETK
jgi:hypothetical protein